MKLNEETLIEFKKQYFYNINLLLGISEKGRGQGIYTVFNPSISVNYRYNTISSLSVGSDFFLSYSERKYIQDNFNKKTKPDFKR